MAESWSDFRKEKQRKRQEGKRDHKKTGEEPEKKRPVPEADQAGESAEGGFSVKDMGISFSEPEPEKESQKRIPDASDEPDSFAQADTDEADMIEKLASARSKKDEGFDLPDSDDTVDEKHFFYQEASSETTAKEELDLILSEDGTKKQMAGSDKPSSRGGDQKRPGQASRERGRRRANQASRKRKQNASARVSQSRQVQGMSGTKRQEKPVRTTAASKPPKPPLSPKARRRRIRMAARLLFVLMIIGIFSFCVYFYMARRTYHGYRILKTSEQEDTASSNYLMMKGKILRYSTDGVLLEDKDLNTLWSETFSISNPIADVRGSCAVVADRDGTDIYMFNTNGMTGHTVTGFPIVKVCVSATGMVAAILDGGGDTWINYYKPDGAILAENQTTLEDPGYPLDVALYDNGEIMMVTYQFIRGGKTTSYVAFYNFGDAGQSADDRIVSGFTYEQHVIPEVECLAKGKSVAVRDDGLVLYSGTHVPDQNREVTVEQEIVSTFFDDDTIGLVFKTSDKNNPYRMDVYGTDGKEKFSKTFAIPYTTVKMSDGYILMYNSAQLCVFNEDGIQRYLGTIDGTISDVEKIGFNRYLLILDTGVKIMALK
jgi:hypothetical protein